MCKGSSRVIIHVEGKGDEGRGGIFLARVLRTRHRQGFLFFSGPFRHRARDTCDVSQGSVRGACSYFRECAGPRAGRCGEQVTERADLSVFLFFLGSDIDGTYVPLTKIGCFGFWERLYLSLFCYHCVRVGCLCVMPQSALDDLGDTYHSPCPCQGWVGKLPRHI